VFGTTGASFTATAVVVVVGVVVGTTHDMTGVGAVVVVGSEGTGGSLTKCCSIRLDLRTAADGNAFRTYFLFNRLFVVGFASLETTVDALFVVVIVGVAFGAVT
jgi:hypothetical protein